MVDGEFRFVFYAQDYEKTVGFYRDGLDLPIVGGWDRGIDDQGTLFGAARGIIEVVFGRGRDFAPPMGSWLLFQVDDVDSCYQRALERGLPIKQDLLNRPWGHRDFKVSDPNGIVIGLFSATN